MATTEGVKSGLTPGNNDFHSLNSVFKKAIMPEG